MMKLQAMEMINKLMTMLTYIYPGIQWGAVSSCDLMSLFGMTGTIDGSVRWTLETLRPVSDSGEYCVAILGKASDGGRCELFF